MRQKSSTQLSLGLTLLTVLFCSAPVGCGNGGSGGGGGGGGGNEIGGTINAASFTLPAGQTRTVTSDLTVNTTGDIQIDGTLQVNPGVNVTLSAGGDLKMTGQITPTPGKAALSRRVVSRGPSAYDIVLVGKNVDIEPMPGASGAGISALPGASVDIETDSTPGTITIGKDITTANGLDAPDNTGQAGGSAGDITIGSNKFYAKFIPGTVIIRSSLIAGNGGHGSDDKRLNPAADPMVLKGGDGGFGGNVIIHFAGQVTLTGATLRAGYGGRGGDCGDRADPTVVRAADSHAVGLAGHSLSATTGNGGAGGVMEVTRIQPGPSVEDQTPPGALGGVGGAPGSLYAAAGNGGPGGPGGNVTTLFGLPGPNGHHAPAGIVPAKAEAILHDSGNGGDSTDANHNGGDGGYVLLLPASGDPPAYISKASFFTCGNGGKGFSCLSMARPQATNGGNAGNVPKTGPFVALQLKKAPYSLLPPCFTGGQGGDGTPVGEGGGGGFDDSGSRLGPDGDPGAIKCGPSSVIINTGVCQDLKALESANLLAVTLPTQNKVAFYDTSTNSFAPKGSVSVGSPYNLALSGNLLYVTSNGSSSVSVINPATLSVTVTVPVGFTPTGIAANSNLNRLDVLNFGGDALSFIDTTSNKVTKNLSLNSPGQHVAVNIVTNRIYVTSPTKNTVYVFDGPTGNLLASLPVGKSPQDVAVDETTNTVYVAESGDNTLTVIDGGLNTVTKIISVGQQPQGVAVNPKNHRVYVTNSQDNTVDTIDTTTNTVTSTTPVGKGPAAISLNTLTNKIFVANSDGTVTVLDGSTLRSASPPSRTAPPTRSPGPIRIPARSPAPAKHSSTPRTR
jgi:YVTN family beta-propeller protein